MHQLEPGPVCAQIETKYSQKDNTGERVDCHPAYSTPYQSAIQVDGQARPLAKDVQRSGWLKIFPARRRDILASASLPESSSNQVMAEQWRGITDVLLGGYTLWQGLF